MKMKNGNVTNGKNKREKKCFSLNSQSHNHNLHNLLPFVNISSSRSSSAVPDFLYLPIRWKK